MLEQWHKLTNQNKKLATVTTHRIQRHRPIPNQGDTMKIKQFTTVHHIDYGKGKVVSLTPKGKDMLVMCFFPQANEHEWVLQSQLESSTDDYVFLEPPEPPTDEVSDDLNDLITQAFFGGQPPQRG